MNQKRVLKTNLLLLLVIAAILTVQRFLTSDLQIALSVLMATGSASAVALFVYYFNMPFFMKGLLMSITPFYVSLALSIILGGIPHMFLIYIGSFTLAALYFNTKLLTVTGIIVNGSIVVAYIFNPTGLLGSEASLSDLIVKLGMMDSIGFLVLFLLTKWDNEALNLSMENQEKSDHFIEKSEELSSTIEDGEKHTQVFKEHFQKMEEVFQQIYDELQKEQNEISDVAEEIKKTLELVVRIAAISEENASSTQELFASTDELKKQIHSLSSEMEKIAQLKDELSHSMNS
ncbi:MAG: hypothetical protein U9N62_08035 [Thermotogota bacterium]|nr:hypothetical protein [Thermotogota bacterium]